MTGFRRGVRLGIDVGRARIGVARCDADGMLAVPVETVPRGDESIARILALVAEHEPIEAVIGLPVNLRGDDTASTTDSRRFAAELAGAGVPVRLVDERLSTVSAHQALRASGRSARRSRSMVDQVAAVVLLQHAIDSEKQTGSAPGSSVSPQQERPDDA